MNTTRGRRLVLHEFRLNEPDADRTVQDIVAMAGADGRPSVPLLTSIEDPRDVATLRTEAEQDSMDADGAERATLAPYVSAWQPLRAYQLRIAERAEAAPRHYRMAVTESGINDVADLPPPAPPGTGREASTPIALLWIGEPVGTHAGLLVLLGDEGTAQATTDRGPGEWPLPLSRDLGVRIYESAVSVR